MLATGELEPLCAEEGEMVWSRETCKEDDDTLGTGGGAAEFASLWSSALRASALKTQVDMIS